MSDLKILIKSAFAKFPGTILSNSQKLGGVILRYHSVRPAEQNADLIPAAISHTPEQFDAQIKWLKRNFEIVSLDQVPRYLSGEVPAPRNYVCITFDDGFEDNFSYAAPILERHGVRGTFFPITGSIDSHRDPWFCRTYRAFRITEAASWTDEAGHLHSLESEGSKGNARRASNRRCAAMTGVEQSVFLDQLESALGVQPVSSEKLMMSWSQLRELAARGHTIGSHTCSHPNLTLLSDADVDSELRVSRAVIEENIGSEIQHLSYPNPIIQPHSNNRVKDIARSCGYRSAGSSNAGYVRETSDPLALHRLAAPNGSIGEFVWSVLFRFRSVFKSAQDDI